MSDDDRLLNYLVDSIERRERALDRLEALLQDAEDAPENEDGMIQVTVEWRTLLEVVSAARRDLWQDSLLERTYPIAKRAVRDLVDMLMIDQDPFEGLPEHGQSRENLIAWYEGFIEKVQQRAWRQARRAGLDHLRSVCPLCGATPRQDGRGWTLPEGLYRHLSGYGNTYECPVMVVLKRSVEGASDLM